MPGDQEDSYGITSRINKVFTLSIVIGILIKGFE